MQLFYTKDISNDLAILDPEESRHCLQVLRKRTGDVITLVDGEGMFYEAEIVEGNKKNCVCRIRRSWAEARGTAAIHIAIAPTKNINRLEWFLEKAAEIGVDRITPILCRHSERKTIRPERLEKLLLSAMKQSIRARLPQLAELTDLADLLKEEATKESQKFIAYIDKNVNLPLRENYVSGRDVCILIGPEGGFSPEEASLAQQHGFVPVSLGPHRLRTETAGLFACVAIHVINGQ